MKLKTNPKLILSIFILLIACILVFCACGKSASNSDIASECVRIHIRANSNSENDQSVKLCVRDEITNYLANSLEGCNSKTDALAKLTQEKEQLVKIANNVLHRNGYEYKASITLNNEYFPDRQYDGYDFPAGYYDALIIYLGQGVGDNWWCVAFPPLCFIPDDDSGEKIIYKSWIKEKIEQIFSK